MTPSCFTGFRSYIKIVTKEEVMAAYVDPYSPNYAGDLKATFVLLLFTLLAAATVGTLSGAIIASFVP
jgi:hypothetical protein